jgi:DNA-binding GntR family transcriptional regulator
MLFLKLRDAIINGDLKPGERLMEIKLADKMGVSRTPVREAIRKLELEGLVLMIPRRGAEVAPITENDLRDVLEVRKAMERLAVELVCEKITEKEIAELERELVELKLAVENDDINEIVKNDVEFHDIIYEATEIGG